jgi:predicted nucleic acid-binding protein
VHEGHEWLYVVTGRHRLALGEQDFILTDREAAEFDTRVPHAEWATNLVHPDDVHVLAAARRVGARVLITGDITDFGHLMKRDDLAVRVRTLRAFLLEGPSRPQ